MADRFGLDAAMVPDPRHNLAPTRLIPVVRLGPETGRPEIARLRWGLIPPWARDDSGASRLINARSETAAEKPVFRQAFRKRRCLVPADGFFEWRRSGIEGIPWFFRLKDRRLMAMAGLWERWQSPDGPIVDSCALLTTGANELVRRVHHRMPVIIPDPDYEAWLDPDQADPETLNRMMKPYPAGLMAGHPVGTWANDPNHDGPLCIEPAEDGQLSLW